MKRDHKLLSRLPLHGPTLLAAAWMAAALPAMAHDYEELLVTTPSTIDLFGGAIDVDGDLAAVGSSSYGGRVYLMKRVNGEWQHASKITPQQPYSDAHFGNDVSLFGEWLAIGAPGDDEVGPEAGAVYLYRQYAPAAYTFHSKLFSEFPGSGGGSFGLALDGEGTTLTVGEPLANGVAPGSGSAEVFQFDGDNWVSRQRLNATSGLNQKFGWSVDMDGLRIAIGAPDWNDALPGAGGVNVFDYDPTFGVWVRSHFLRSQDVADLGRSVALESGQLVSGSPATGQDSGALVFFTSTVLSSNQIDVHYGNQAGAGLGQSVDIGYDPNGVFRAAAGAHKSDDVASDQGAIQIMTFVSSLGWIPTATLRTAEASASAWLGVAVCFDGYEVLGGAPLAEAGIGSGGSVRRFDISGGSWVERAGFFGTSVDYGEYFGSDVAIAGDLAVVGSERDSEVMFGAGAAYVFERDASGWTHVSSLYPGIESTSEAGFGATVTTDGERILIGAPNQTDWTGAAYIFERNATGKWLTAGHLVPSDGNSNDYFGEALALDGDMAVVGSHQADGASSGSGAAYVFRRNSAGNWYESQKLIVANTDSQSNVGTSVALDVDAGELLVGVTGEKMVARFTWSGSEWTPAFPLFPGAGYEDAGFGTELALAGDELAIAAPNIESRATIHVYRRVAGGWGFREAIVRDARYFGMEMGYDGERLVAGYRHGVYAYQRFDQLWQSEELEPATFDDLSGYPASTSLSGNSAVQGAERGGTGGRAWVITLDEPGPFLAYGFGDGSGSACPCGNESAPGAGEGCANTTGRGALLRGEGSNSIATDDMELVAEGIPSGRIGQLFAGVSNLPGLPFGDGQRLVGAPIRRLEIHQADGNGSARYGINHSIGFWNAGETRYFQVFYRDAGAGMCGNGFNTSSGLAVLFRP